MIGKQKAGGGHRSVQGEQLEGDREGGEDRRQGIEAVGRAVPRAVADMGVALPQPARSLLPIPNVGSFPSSSVPRT